jgi:DNA helicase HerA-like ATPase
VGDPEKPKLCLFIDEAHLIFSTATPALLQQIETIIKLIRSKGVGVFFCTQNPMDVPDSVLGQLGLKVQHALRAFTAKDRTAIKKTAENYPLTSYYKTEELLTSLGIGEAIVSALSEKGTPTPLAHTLMRAPATRMDILNPTEIQTLVGNSAMARKYNEVIDRESAFEMLNTRMKAHEQPEEDGPDEEEEEKQEKEVKKGKEEKGALEKLSENTMVRQVGRTVANVAMRGLLGVLGIKAAAAPRRRRRRNTGFFS